MHKRATKKLGIIDDKVTVCREVLPTKLRYHSLEFCHFVLYNIDIENKGSAKNTVSISQSRRQNVRMETDIKPKGRDKKRGDM